MTLCSICKGNELCFGDDNDINLCKLVRTDSDGSCYCGIGAGDGSVSLFDVRTGGSIVRLPLSSTWEVRKACCYSFHSFVFFVATSTVPPWCFEVHCRELGNVQMSWLFPSGLLCYDTLVTGSYRSESWH